MRRSRFRFGHLRIRVRRPRTGAAGGENVPFVDQLLVARPLVHLTGKLVELLGEGVDSGDSSIILWNPKPSRGNSGA